MDLLYFFSPDRPVALVLNLVIAGALIVGFLAVVRALWRLRIESKDLKRILDAKPKTSEAVPQVKSSGWIKDQLKLLQGMQARSRAISEDAVMGMADETLHQRIATPLFLRSTLVLLGLAGTLWGLSVAVTDLSSTLAGTGLTVGAMKDAILGTLAGMKTAFSTTLAGVGAAVLLSVLTRWYEAKKSGFLKDLEEANLTLLIPLFDTSGASVLDSATERLEHLTHSMEERLDALLERLDTRGEKLTREVQEAVDQFVRTFADRSKALLKEIREIRERTVAIFGTPNDEQKSLAEQVEGFTSGIELLQQTTGEVRLLIPRLSKAITDAIGEQKRSLQEVLTAESLEIKKLNELHQAWGASLTEATQQIASGQKEFVQQTGQLSAAAREFNSSWSRIEESVQGTETEISTSMETLRQEIRATLRDVSGSFEETHRAVLANLARFEKALTETNKAIAAEPRRAVRQSSELLDELRRVVNNVLPELAQTMAGAGEKGSGRVETAIRELTREIRSLAAGNGRTTPSPRRSGTADQDEATPGGRATVDPGVFDEIREEFGDDAGQSEAEA